MLKNPGDLLLGTGEIRLEPNSDGPPIVEIAQPPLPPSAASDSKILDGLNAQQRQVVLAVEGPILCIAGAGSGKTMTLIHRCAYLIDQGIPPEQILLLTFTRAAASSMLRRARSLVPRAENVVGGTFHSVAVQVLRQAHSMFDLPKNFSILATSFLSNRGRIAESTWFARSRIGWVDR